ncbi:DEAD/DEAH box helicase family protein [Streptomyces albus]|uniref:DEAD/DEAH box helicase family protein n=1 Tax=Streptomyces albus TaxID=1888 RepID=UPI0013B499CA|nr:DEAD/DEAH box helicase family protein [Streptomyces albus]QID39804.1 DEAD/DEAH box helicase family protein [Streptomyces albus]
MRKSVSLVLDTEQMAMELFPHQVRALAAIRRAVRRGERRMTVVAACGTGKTLIACRAAEQVAPSGAVLVLMPTLALVTQTISRWREAATRGGRWGCVRCRSPAVGWLAPRR